MQKRMQPQLKVIRFAPVVSPRIFAKPASVRFGTGKGIAGKGHHFADDPVAVLQSFKWLPAAVGVYGPVATSLSLGSRLLSTNR
jgi:hypothetical protein